MPAFALRFPVQLFAMLRLSVWSVVLSLVSHVAQAAQPHIVFIMADDFGSNDISYSDPSVISPELADLAAGGMKLSHVYTYSWCAPSRGAFLSGRYPSNTGFYGGGDSPGKDIAVFPLKYSFLPQALKSAGYATVMAGKWHVGYARQADLPENRGFDKFLGYLQGGEDYYTRQTKMSTSNCSTSYDFWFGTPGNGRPAAAAEYWTGEYSTTLYTEFLVQQIRRHDPATPLFVYAAYQGIHYPLQVPKQYFDRYESQGAGKGDCAWDKQQVIQGYASGFHCQADPAFPNVKPGYACLCNRLVVKAQVSALSEGVGNITRALKEKGMWNNTVLVFMGDNGGPLDGGHSNTPLRGGKLNFFEGGVRPAAFITSPLLPSAVHGSTYSGMAHETDWYATFARLAGAPKANDIDGVDMWDSLQNLRTTHRNEVLITDHILRKGKWKFVAGAGDGEGANVWRSGNLKGCMLGTGGGWMVPPENASNLCPNDIYTSGQGIACPDDVPKRSQIPVVDKVDLWLCSTPCTMDKPCLWDVETDAREEHEVSSQNPDVVARLLARLKELQSNFGARTTLQDNGKFCEAAESRRVPGRGLFAGPWLDDSTVDTLLV